MHRLLPVFFNSCSKSRAVVEKIGHQFEKAVYVTDCTSTEESELWWKTKGSSSWELKQKAFK